MNNIFEYAVHNHFGSNEVELRQRFNNQETEMAMHILKTLNEQDNISNFKIFPLYFIGSKSREIMQDRLFWLMLSSITVASRIIKTSSKLKQLCIIAHCVSRLPHHSWVSDQLISELCEKLSED